MLKNKIHPSKFVDLIEIINSWIHRNYKHANNNQQVKEEIKGKIKNCLERRSQDGSVSRAVEISSQKHIELWKYNKEKSS